MSFDRTQTKYWRSWRAGVPCRHYSRAKRNNDMRFGARMNARCHGFSGRAKWCAKGFIRAQREAVEIANLKYGGSIHFANANK